MSKKTLEEIASATPQNIIYSFSQNEQLIGFTMREWMLLESLGCGMIMGQTPTIRDFVAMWCVKRYTAEIELAIASSSQHTYINETIEALTPSLFTAIQIAMAPLIAATFAPLSQDVEQAKKNKATLRDAAGGSASTTSLRMNTDGKTKKSSTRQSAVPSA